MKFYIKLNYNYVCNIPDIDWFFKIIPIILLHFPYTCIHILKILQCIMA